MSWQPHNLCVTSLFDIKKHDLSANSPLRLLAFISPCFSWHCRWLSFSSTLQLAFSLFSRVSSRANQKMGDDVSALLFHGGGEIE